MKNTFKRDHFAVPKFYNMMFAINDGWLHPFPFFNSEGRKEKCVY